ncbi:MAG: ATP-dependent metallopeptidase FtsH/Yme1/Tma family protein [Pseudorhodoplanes sp.]|nr:ATP-dependent metallopeptidase FtsH/Yme1/Tma family protein [Pseudorhodoplanes sp.]
MADAVQQHCTRSWWMRPPVWFIGIAVTALLAFVIFENVGGPAPTPYGTFLDQLDAGNIASITLQGTQINGRFKKPLDDAQSDSFRSQVPEFGDAALIPELRKQHVAIDVASSSSWMSLLGRLPLPMLIIIGVVLIAGAVRLVRGGKVGMGLGSAASMHPMGGMMGLVSGLFGKQPQTGNPPQPGSHEPKGR